MPFVVVTLNPSGANEAERRSASVVRGATSRLPILQEAGIARARVLVAADDDAEVTEGIIAIARNANRAVRIVVSTNDPTEADALRDAGADAVVVLDEGDVSPLVAQVLAEAADPLVDPNGSACTHLDQIRDVIPSGAGCEECRKMGDSWVHLRLCLSCGKVACCDSSKNRHASRHAHDAGHPIVQSFEPHEDWRWCYVDQVYLS